MLRIIFISLEVTRPPPWLVSQKRGSAVILQGSGGLTWKWTATTWAGEGSQSSGLWAVKLELILDDTTWVRGRGSNTFLQNGK